MKIATLSEDDIWAANNTDYSEVLLGILSSRECLVVIEHGQPKYRVVIGVPHQTAIGEEFICEKNTRRRSDENAVSYALVTFSHLAENDIPCRIVIATHAETEDPNKVTTSSYFKEIFAKPCELLLECHGAAAGRSLDLEVSAGSNGLTNTERFGYKLWGELQLRYKLGVQTAAGKAKAMIFCTDGTKIEGSLENPAIHTDSLIAAGTNGIPALHLEAKPVFRKPADNMDRVTEDGCILGLAIARAIMKDSQPW
jgi:hypothetical protein